MKKTLVIAIVLMAASLTGIFSTLAYATDGGDESEINTEQSIAQKNVYDPKDSNYIIKDEHSKLTLFSLL
jgi:Tfp pilus assembly protein PilV